ncbi:hypothetical protein L1987_13714 [Smallanthus sonchifolius]|uniref:Uncharacterized protein n=1 Tax=Smallanthus sonchifolius TaxID=185202 RepID=A0ACB9JHP1_9ASTR|nr:hypothetical protein L1987_13714 [Smallanthus sonchifolius]
MLVKEGDDKDKDDDEDQGDMGLGVSASSDTDNGFAEEVLYDTDEEDNIDDSVDVSSPVQKSDNEQNS